MLSEMQTKVVLLFCGLSFALSLRIPENPCPNVFTYFKSKNGEVYGEAKVPFDGKNDLVLAVNVSMSGMHKKANLKIDLATPTNEITTSSKLRYNIFFPLKDNIPRITRIVYNDKEFCSGPSEPLTPGGAGYTNLWSEHIFYFRNVGTFNRSNIDDSSNSNSNNNDKDEINDDELLVKDPTSAAAIQPRPNFNKPEEKLTQKPTSNEFISSGSQSPSNNEPKEQEFQKCGVSNGLTLPLIFGGTETRENEYPWLTAMFAYDKNKNNYVYKCTANLISERHVLTAARCVQYSYFVTVKTEDILIVLGKSDLTHWATSGAVTRGASNVQVHPDSRENPRSAHADIAVITLVKSVPFSRTIRPVCLWKDSSDLGLIEKKSGVISGWGRDEDAEKNKLDSISKANFVEVPVVSQFDCLKAGEIFRNITSKETFCAGSAEGRGPCIGDAGAGFVIPINGIYHIRGIASISSAGCNSEKYSVFCDVAKYLDWIAECMKK